MTQNERVNKAQALWNRFAALPNGHLQDLMCVEFAGMTLLSAGQCEGNDGELADALVNDFERLLLRAEALPGVRTNCAKV